MKIEARVYGSPGRVPYSTLHCTKQKRLKFYNVCRLYDAYKQLLLSLQVPAGGAAARVTSARVFHLIQRLNSTRKEFNVPISRFQLLLLSELIYLDKLYLFLNSVVRSRNEEKLQ